MLLALLCLFTATPAAAQFGYGFKAGVNLTQKPSYDLNTLKQDLNGNAGWFAGPTIKFIAPVIGLGVEAGALYSQYSINIEGQDIKTQSIDIPIYLRYELSLPVASKFVIPFIAVGPQFSWNLGNKEYTLDDLTNLENSELKKYTLNSSDLSLNLGLGIILFKHLEVHGNYNLALGKTGEITDFGMDDIKNAMELKTSKWQVSLAYVF